MAAVRITENTVPLFLYHCCIRVATRMCLPSCCLETSLVYLLISRSLYNNCSTRYNTIAVILLEGPTKFSIIMASLSAENRNRSRNTSDEYSAAKFVTKLLLLLLLPPPPLLIIIIQLNSVQFSSVVGIATGYGLNDRGVRVRVAVGSRIFSTPSRPTLGSAQPPIQWVQGALSPGVKRPGREADHSPPSSAEIKEMWIYTSTPTPSWHSAELVKHRDNFTLRANLIAQRPW
jgi:hypothetical protein